MFCILFWFLQRRFYLLAEAYTNSALFVLWLYVDFVHCDFETLIIVNAVVNDPTYFQILAGYCLKAFAIPYAGLYMVEFLQCFSVTTTVTTCQ